MKLIFVVIYLITVVSQKLVTATDEQAYNALSKMENPSVLEEYSIQDDPERDNIIRQILHLMRMQRSRPPSHSFGGYGGYDGNHVTNAGSTVFEVISPEELEIQRLELQIAEIEAAIIAHGGVVPEISDDDYIY